MSVGFRDYYDTLGVSRDASEEEIRRAYRRLARENHPDVSREPDAGQRFAEISEAYEVLRDPDKRRQYDRLGANWRAGQDVSGAEGFGGFGGGYPGGGAGGPSGGWEDVRVDFGDGAGGGFGGGPGMSDFFDQLFGRGAARGGTGAGGRGAGGRSRFEGFTSRGDDVEAVLELPLEEAAAGGRRSISLADGRDYEVEIPPGVRDGQRIRLAGEGAEGIGGGPRGDLFLRVRIRPHRRFRLDGRDVYLDLPAAPWEAALGATVRVPTLRGSARLRIPAGTSSGRRLRLRGEGMPDPGGRPGDLYAVVQIHVPRRLTREQRELFERLAQASSDFDPRAGL
ncbi:DnaJ C-terminal domain-containing protein [Conexibacter woesei]|uniref:Chaperone DnaJ domain protein n=1 Tax=Conexibacter woesei (strain DSM 14684 / CCUG 47730 / CIP 108061 / JCM 11494 / NBRC 100937 / ID131577) TaxID=469383 RepID=D3F9B5_CONWI|nr:DnaJ C-terminal domain-containing protein [Conexibacter woesei]ADB49082.1 chaperone DnaJ domain protein [Conexibacter woesei DSM 14684]